MQDLRLQLNLGQHNLGGKDFAPIVTKIKNLPPFKKPRSIARLVEDGKLCPGMKVTINLDGTPHAGIILWTVHDDDGGRLPDQHQLGMMHRNGYYAIPSVARA